MGFFISWVTLVQNRRSYLRARFKHLQISSNILKPLTTDIFTYFLITAAHFHILFPWTAWIIIIIMLSSLHHFFHTSTILSSLHHFFHFRILKFTLTCCLFGVVFVNYLSHKSQRNWTSLRTASGTSCKANVQVWRRQTAVDLEVKNG